MTETWARCTVIDLRRSHVELMEPIRFPNGDDAALRPGGIDLLCLGLSLGKVSELRDGDAIDVRFVPTRQIYPGSAFVEARATAWRWPTTSHAEWARALDATPRPATAPDRTP